MAKKLSKKEKIAWAKGDVLTTAILALCRAAHLEGSVIAPALMACLVEVVYNTTEKKDKETLKKLAKMMSEDLTDILVNYEDKLNDNKEADNEQG